MLPAFQTSCSTVCYLYCSICICAFHVWYSGSIANVLLLLLSYGIPEVNHNTFLFYRCDTCVGRIFLKGAGECPECKLTLRRANFKVQQFEDSFVDKECDIRRKVLAM